MDTASSSDTPHLQRLLDEVGSSQAALARALGFQRTTINNWCRGRVPPEHVSRICEALGLDAARSAQFARAVDAPLPRSVELVVWPDVVTHG